MQILSSFTQIKSLQNQKEVIDTGFTCFYKKLNYTIENVME